MDVTEALRSAENSLRDFISEVLRNKFGDEWIQHCGVSPERVDDWEATKEEEKRKKKGILTEHRLIYYSNFYDLKKILQKHWNQFSPVFGNLKRFELIFDELAKFRNPEAHRRDLLPYEKHLAIGLSGEIRTRIVIYRGKMETADDYFPRIESVADNLGNNYTPDKRRFSLFCTRPVRSGDTVEFVISAYDPLDEDLLYSVSSKSRDSNFVTKSQLNPIYTFSDADIGTSTYITVAIRSQREHHARQEFDDFVDFSYTVLPKKN